MDRPLKLDPNALANAVLPDTGSRDRDQDLTRSSRDFIELIPAATEKPNVEKLGELIDRMYALTGKEPRAGQVLAVHLLLNGTRDVLFQAATGYGKSMIWQCVPKLGDGICLMISPLNLLTQQQSSGDVIPQGCNGQGITHQNNSNALYEDVAQGRYTHVCLSPELATSRRFGKMVLQNSAFRQKRIFVVIDEVHVVENWSTFRKEYAKLWQFRNRLPPGTRMLGCSATLDDTTRDVVIKNAGFRNPQILNTTTDRPEVYIEIRGDKSIGQSHFGLRFLVPDKVTVDEVQSKIDKTIVFFDSKQDIRIARLEIRQWLIGAGLNFQQANQVVNVYYSSIGSTTKKRLAEEFIPSNSPCRIMLTTEAMGMGVEMQGVKNVVQYDNIMITRSIQNLKVLVQRMGRAARKSGEQGHFIWLVRPWMLPSTQPYAVPYQSSSRLSATQTLNHDDDLPTHQSKSMRERREKMASVYQDLCTRCPRDVLLRFFTPKGSRLERLPCMGNARCCFHSQRDLIYKDKSIWTFAKFEATKKRIEAQDQRARAENPELLLSLPSDTRLLGDAKLYGPVITALRQWRSREADKLTNLYGQVHRSELVLPDSTLDRLAQGNSKYSTDLEVRYIHHFQADWSDRFERGSDVQKVIKDVVQNVNLLQDSVQTKKTFQISDKKIHDEELERIVAGRRQRCIQRYGENANAIESQLPGDSVTLWVKAMDKKRKKSSNAQKKKVSDQLVPRVEEADPLIVNQPLNKFMAGRDDDSENTEIESPQSVQSSQSVRRAEPSQKRTSLDQPRVDPASPSQVEDSFVTAREEQLSESFMRSSSPFMEQPRTPNRKRERGPHISTTSTPLAYRSSPQSQEIPPFVTPNTPKPRRRHSGQNRSLIQKTPASSDSEDSNTTIASQISVSQRGRQRFETRKLREGRL